MPLCHRKADQQWPPPKNQPDSRRTLARAAFNVYTLFPLRILAGLVITAMHIIAVIGPGLGFQEWEMTTLLVKAKRAKCHNHSQPVQVIGDDRTVCGAVGPSQDGVEDAPAATAVQFGIAAVDMPDTLSDVIRP